MLSVPVEEGISLHAWCRVPVLQCQVCDECSVRLPPFQRSLIGILRCNYHPLLAPVVPFTSPSPPSFAVLCTISVRLGHNVGLRSIYHRRRHGASTREGRPPDRQ